MTNRNTFKRTTLKSAVALSVLLALGACSSDDDDDVAAVVTDMDQAVVTDMDQMVETDVETVTVLLDAAQEIPAPVGVPAGAMGTAEVSVDADGIVTATLVVSNLSGPAQMAHIHEGLTGEAGPVLIGLMTQDGGTTWTVQGDAPALTEEQIEAFNNGGMYFNVHTEANAPGEIRGQINGENAPEQAGTTMVLLDAGQEIPAPVGVPADAMGSADVSVDANGVVTATVVVSGLSGPAQMAHIHQGFPGEAGPVLIGLMTQDGGMTWTVQGDAPALTEEQIGAFNRGELYFNVHTEANAPGEIRGQIEPEGTMAVNTTQRLVSSIAEIDGTEVLTDTETGLVWVNDIRFCFAGVTRPEDSMCGVLSDMAVSGITDWRLPTSVEMSDVTLAVDADESIEFNFINAACAVMTASDGWVFTENSNAPGMLSPIEPGNAGVRCVSGNSQ